jgi:capsular exopolysaccharide synthesis family protein
MAAYVGGTGSTEFDMLRTRVLQQIEPQGWRRIAVTSPDPACGKSTVAANLAFSLARQEGQRVLLIELDLRKPSLAKLLGIQPGAGIGDLLAGDAKIEDCALRLGRNLAVIPANGPSRNPAELLRSPGTIAALANIESCLAPTITLFDLPPMLANDDAMAFVGRTDCAILVAAAEATTIKQIDACERDLATQTNVLGVVLNKCRYIDRGAAYYSYD